MNRLTQKNIAKTVGVTQSFVNQLVLTKKRPNWKMAKKLTLAVPGTTPVLWLEGSEQEIKDAIKNANASMQEAS